MKSIVSGTVLLLLFVSMFTFTSSLKLASSTSSLWWNSDWQNRIRVNITENSGYDLTDFPIEVTFEHNGNVQTNGTDIRVIDNSFEIPSYVEECNSTHATIISEINLTASESKIIFIYYGNPNAATPSYPLVPLPILEGNNGHAIIDNRIYIGWNYTSWGWSNNVELWNDFRIDFNENKDPTDDSNLIRSYSSRQGGIGRHRANVQAIGLGDYQGYTQTSIYVDINFADAKLRVYRNNPWVETTQADYMQMFSPSYTYENYGGGTEQNIVDGQGINNPEGYGTGYSWKENPGWMAFRDSASGYVFASTGLKIGNDYAYEMGGKEGTDWDRNINYNNRTRYEPVLPYDQPSDCRIYWYGDNSNNYSKIETIAQILNNQPSSFVESEGFFDDFNGNSLDTAKWIAQPNDGTIAVANSSVILSSEGSTFPTVYTQENPFPIEGDFMLEFDLTYTRATGDGTGFWVSNGAWEIPPPIPNILLIWQDALVFSSFRYLRVWLLGNVVFNSSNVDLFRHQFLLGYSNQTYVLYMDGVKLASVSSSLRPTVIGFGHPPPIPAPYPRPWTSFKIDKIAAYSLQPYLLTVNTFRNDVPIASNMTLLDQNKTIIQTVNGISTYDWLLPFGTYYVQASIFCNGFAYASEQIQVNLTDYTELAINFLFGNLTVSCEDIENRPLQNCTVIFTRQDESRVRYTDSLGLTTLEAYYGNWTAKAYWMDVLVGEASINVNQSEVDTSISCKVGDFTVIVVDQYGHPIEANVTLRNDIHDLTHSGYIRKPLENMTFTQIPLIDYNLTIRDDFGTQAYSVNAEQTRQIQIETLPLPQKLIYIIIGTIAGIVISSLGVWIITKRKRTNTLK